MIADPISVSLFEMRLEEIYHRDPVLKYQVSLRDFIALFPVKSKNDKLLKPEPPASIVLDRDIFLQILVAFNQSFA
ncbi:hypothetical protein LX99_01441 [Mucilaginibacter oryzae]|uniref:Uncharacterized protein n=2 Tax=Mucilaginibacter oryzae TaxID=468058 RepID=A0A316HF12_9SPHI|nr:hypothetical protein LX99_01441 [Mucilaginibacter oryzae]